MSLIGRVIQSISLFFESISTLRWTLAPAVLAFGMFSLPEQSKDIYRIYAVGISAHVLELVLFVGILVVFTIILRSSGAFFSRQFCKKNEDTCAESLPMLGALTSTAMALPWLGISTGLYRALPSKFSIKDLVDIDQTKFGYPLGAMQLMGIIVTILAAVVLMLASKQTKSKQFIEAPSFIERRRTRLLTYSFIATACFLPFAEPVAIPVFLGPFVLVGLFSVVLALTLLALSRATSIYGVPFIPVLVTLSLIFASLDLNDNHKVRTVVRSPQSVYVSSDEIYYLETEFLTWLKSRKDFEYYRRNNKPYPIFVVAAPGGGLYAAYHSALTLAHIQDHCPNFAQHIFAISGVSGGSLGATVFTRLSEQFAQNSEFRPCNINDASTQVFQKKVRSILQNDFLSPLLWRGLFPDLLQAFLPYPIEQFDRARGLESSFESAWAKAVPESPEAMRVPFLQSWNPQNVAPLLLLNTTDVNTGEQVVFMPFGSILLFGAFSPVIDHAGIGLNHDDLVDFPTSSVVGLSARFPWITPAGWIDSYELENVGDGLRKEKLQLADGGYFENSGAEVALSVVEVLRKALEPSYLQSQDKAFFDSIVRQAQQTSGTEYDKISSAFVVKTISFENLDYRYWTDNSQTGFSELASPMRALMATRQQRGELATLRALNSYYCPHCYTTNLAAQEARSFSLSISDYPIPLGWYLSPTSSNFIDAQISDFRGCKTQVGVVYDDPKGPMASNYEKSIEENGCENFLVAQDIGIATQ